MIKATVKKRRRPARAGLRPPAPLVLATTFASCVAAVAWTQTIDLSGLPPEARLPGMALRLQASIAGIHLFRCVSTDVVGQYGWRLARSAGSLTDQAGAPIGETEITYSGAPVVRAEAVWRDAQGGAIAAIGDRIGAVPGAPDLQWRRFRVRSTTGAGPLAGTRYVIRVAAWRILPYATPCDKAHAGDQATAPFHATDWFTDDVLPPPD